MVVSHHFSIECDKSFRRRQGTRDVGVTVEGAKGETTVSFSMLDGEDALLFSAKDTGCYDVGGEKARGYHVDKDPITLG